MELKGGFSRLLTTWRPTRPVAPATTTVGKFSKPDVFDMLIPQDVRLLAASDLNNERPAGPVRGDHEGFSANAFALPALDTIAKIPIHNIIITEFVS